MTTTNPLGGLSDAWHRLTDPVLESQTLARAHSIAARAPVLLVGRAPSGGGRWPRSRSAGVSASSSTAHPIPGHRAATFTACEDQSYPETSDPVAGPRPWRGRPVCPLRDVSGPAGAEVLSAPVWFP